MWDQVPPELKEHLEHVRRVDACITMLQRQTSQQITASFAEAGIEHAFIKGVLLREMLYKFPHERPSDDIDIVIPRSDLRRASRVLVAAGFEPKVKAMVTHEVSFVRARVSIDLHWNLFRPGRSRVDLVPLLLATKTRFHDLPTAPDLITSVLLTVSAALGDYVTARLIRAIDLDRWIRAERLPWSAFVGLVQDCGLAVAAWAMLTWTRDLLGTPVPAEYLERLQPEALRRSYICSWINEDPAAIYHSCPTVARVGFSLALHDSWGDLLRAVRAKVRNEGMFQHL